MTKTCARLLAVPLLAALSLYACNQSPEPPPAPTEKDEVQQTAPMEKDEVQPLEIGAAVTDFTLTEVHEKSAVSLADYEQAALFAIIFISRESSVSNAYMSRLVELHQMYQSKGVQFLAVNSNEAETFSAFYGQLPFPILKDRNYELADHLQAVVTPEAFLIQPIRAAAAEDSGETKYILRYSGALDDAQDAGKVEKQYLKEAIDALLSGGGANLKRILPTAGWPIDRIRPLEIGTAAADFTLIDVREKSAVSLADYEQAAAFAIIFIGINCEASNAYLSRLSELHQTYQPKGVQFLAVNPNEDDKLSAVEEHAEAHQLPFPVLKDLIYELADQLQAVVTPEAFLIQPVRPAAAENGGETKYILRYSGALDDAQDAAKVKTRHLKEAIDALLSGGGANLKRVQPEGWPIDRVDNYGRPLDGVDANGKPKATP